MKVISTAVKENCTEGAIAAYYKDNELKHTARYKQSASSTESMIWSSKLGAGPVVEHQIEDLTSIYGDVVDFYNVLG